MPEADDNRFMFTKGGSPVSFEREHWAEGSEADGSAGIEWDVPSGAVSAQVYSSVAAFFGPVAEASLDIAGAGFNAMPIAAGAYGPKISVVGRSKLSAKAVTGNLAVVAVVWGGQES